MVVLSLFLCTLPPARAARMFRWCREIESCVYPPGRTPSRLGDSDNCTSMDMTGSDQGAYNSYVAVHTFWADTTNMDNIRGADISMYVFASAMCSRSDGRHISHGFDCHD